MSNDQDIERYDNDLFRAHDGKWIKFTDHEYAVQQLAERITELNQSVDMHAHALASVKDRAEKAEAQLHALRLVCGTTDANKFETACDRALARAEKAERELAEINNELSRNEIVVVRTENGYRVARGKIIARNQAKGTV